MTDQSGTIEESLFRRFRDWLFGFWHQTPPALPEGYTGALDQYADYAPAVTIDDLFQPGDRIYRQPTDQPGPTPRTRTLAGWSTLRTRVSRFPPSELRLVKIERALVLPRQIIINLRTGLPILDSLRKIPLTGSPIFPVNDFRSAAEIDAILRHKKTLSIEDGFVFYASSRHTAYGHTLLEGMSRMWPVPQIRPRIGTYLIPTSRTDFAPQLYAPFGVGEHNMFRLTKKGLICKNLLMPSQAYLLGRQLSPAFWTIADQVRAFYERPCEKRKRVYISRRKAHKRHIVNEEAVEAEFIAHGFQVIHPEDMSIPDQVATYAAASWIAGPVGSGLYNSIFAPPDVRKIIVGPGNFHTPIDSVISRGHGPLYIFGRKSTDDRRGKVIEDWTIDPERVRYGLARIFAPTLRHKIHNALTFTSARRLGGGA